MSGRALTDEFEIAGEWFLPEAPQRKVVGRLSYRHGRTDLDVYEAFRSMIPRGGGDIRLQDLHQIYPVVHGVTENGEAVSLLGAHRRGSSINFGSGGVRQPERLMAFRLVVGAHVESETTYPEAEIRVPGLPIWLSRPLLNSRYGEKDATGATTMSYEVLVPASEKARLDAIGADLTWLIGYESTIDKFTSVAVKTTGWMRVRPDQPQTLQWYLEQSATLTALLTFLAGTTMSPDCISVALGDPPHRASVLVAQRDAKYCAYRHFHQFYMPRGRMIAEFGVIAAQWFREYSRISAPVQLALSAMSSGNLWLHVEFLSLIQAMEGVHRSLCAGRYMDADAYKAVAAAINAAIPESLSSSHKSSLESRIRYGNEISLAKRLAALAQMLDPRVREAIFYPQAEVPRAWIETRNFLSHWDEAIRAKALEGQDMADANVRMRHFLRALLLTVAGIPQEAIVAALGNNSDESEDLKQLNSRTAAADGTPSAATGPFMRVEVGDGKKPPPAASGPPGQPDASPEPDTADAKNLGPQSPAKDSAASAAQSSSSVNVLSGGELEGSPEQGTARAGQTDGGKHKPT